MQNTVLFDVRRKMSVARMIYCQGGVCQSFLIPWTVYVHIREMCGGSKSKEMFRPLGFWICGQYSSFDGRRHERMVVSCFIKAGLLPFQCADVQSL